MLDQHVTRRYAPPQNAGCVTRVLSGHAGRWFARICVATEVTGAKMTSVTVAAVGAAGDAIGHHPSVSIGNGYVDLKLVSADAIYREDDGTEHVVEWVTQQDVDRARRITVIADQDGNSGVLCVAESPAT